MRKLLLIIAAVAITTTMSVSARADSCTFTGINTGVTGIVNITQLTSNSLTFTLTNTSTGTVTGKITSIGFDLPGANLGTFALVSSTNPNYTLVNNVSGNASGIGTTFEIALLTGPNFNGGGNPNRGIIEGASATFTLSGNFAGLSQQQILNGVYVRFQDVNAGGGSDVAVCCPPPPPEIPEPATMVLLGSGLVGMAAKLRRRRNKLSE